MVIIKHFNDYPLITQKFGNYILWKQAILLRINKEHLTKEGFQKILNLKASINLGLNPRLKKVFLKTVPCL